MLDTFAILGFTLNKHMLDTFAVIGFTFGITGFIISLTMKTQVLPLEMEIEKLKSQIGKKS